MSKRLSLYRPCRGLLRRSVSLGRQLSPLDVVQVKPHLVAVHHEVHPHLEHSTRAHNSSPERPYASSHQNVEQRRRKGGAFAGGGGDFPSTAAAAVCVPYDPCTMMSTLAVNAAHTYGSGRAFAIAARCQHCQWHTHTHAHACPPGGSKTHPFRPLRACTNDTCSYGARRAHGRSSRSGKPHPISYPHRLTRPPSQMSSPTYTCLPRARATPTASSLVTSMMLRCPPPFPC